MCFGPDSRPPVAPIAGAAVPSATIELSSSDGTLFRTFVADAPNPSGAAMLVLPDVRGLHAYYEELALRFAEAGIDALAIDYFGRTAGSGPRPPDFDHQPHVGATRWPQLLDDVKAGAGAVRRRWPHVRALFTVGFCYGGRLALLMATRPELELSGAVGFYGIVRGPGRAEMPAPLDLVGEVTCPVLGLFGGTDPGIPRDSIEEYRRALEAAGVDNDIVVYPGAPHSFFDRKADQFAAESADAWRRVLDFVQSRAAANSR